MQKEIPILFRSLNPKHNFFDQEFHPHHKFLLAEVKDVVIPKPEEGDNPIAIIEAQIIAAVCDKLTHNPVFYKNLIAEFGEDGTIPGVEDLVVHDFDYPITQQGRQKGVSTIHTSPANHLYTKKKIFFILLTMNTSMILIGNKDQPTSHFHHHHMGLIVVPHL